MRENGFKLPETSVLNKNLTSLLFFSNNLASLTLVLNEETQDGYGDGAGKNLLKKPS